MIEINNNYAPILIPTLNRFEHFKRCVESLEKCTLAKYTDLYIALDYPLNDSHREGYGKIKEYTKHIKGFKSIVLIERDRNYGANKNLFTAQKEIFENFDTMILTEDDNEFSSNFLEFINWGLEKYKNNENIFAICGYNYPINLSDYKEDYYFAKEFSAWGCGLWKKKWEYVENNIFKQEYTYKIFNSYNNLSNLLKNRISIIPSLQKCKKGNIILADSLITSYLYIDNKFCLFPKISKVRNWGHDGSGVNGGNIKEDIFKNQEIDLQPNWNKKNENLIIIDKSINKRNRKYFSIPLKSKLKILYNIIFDR